MKKVAQAQALAKLTAVELGYVQAEMARLVQGEARLRQNLIQLQQRQEAQPPASATTEFVATPAVHLRWQRWVDQRKSVINTELAQILAQKENCAAKLRSVFGRDQAAQKLVEKLQERQKLTNQRKQYYES
ncbi:hypothetical protein [Loktanella sp. S4079]|uniref:hypothetical protein n=1 Tax=Loktanella sp. S4079 TaxID=579483 RepID=UPI0005FA1896|nr:hypothetical protein [Loktanella sp. S4079]KJZ21154.1 hypothetical protein TW80_00395 [Loktanella sp. S4079]